MAVAAQAQALPHLPAVVVAAVVVEAEVRAAQVLAEVRVAQDLAVVVLLEVAMAAHLHPLH